jgi:hypothetical protein
MKGAFPPVTSTVYAPRFAAVGFCEAVNILGGVLESIATTWPTIGAPVAAVPESVVFTVFPPPPPPHPDSTAKIKIESTTRILFVPLNITNLPLNYS